MLTRIAAVLIAAHAFLCSPAAAQTAPSFTYQGTFTDNGVPADGLYDISVQVYDSDTLGTLLASALVLDYDVENGLFSIDVAAAPGGVPLFDGSDRWIQVGFRDGAASIFDPFTFTGRTLVKHAPQAAFALTAGALADPIWTKDSFFDSAYWGDGDSRVGINTIFAFPDATLAVHKNTSGTHGIVVSTSSPFGAPFLDLQTGAGGDPMGTRMRLTYDGAFERLGIGPIGSDVVRISESEGLVVPSDSVTAGGFAYVAPELRRVTYSSAAWRVMDSAFESVVLDSGNGGRSYINESVVFTQDMIIPLTFPDGAALSSITVHHFIAPGFLRRLSFGFLRTELDGSVSAFVVFDTFDNFGDVSPAVIPISDTIDNSRYHYALVARSSDWDSGATPPVQVGGAVIEYTVGSPD